MRNKIHIKITEKKKVSETQAFFSLAYSARLIEKSHCINSDATSNFSSLFQFTEVICKKVLKDKFNPCITGTEHY